MSSFLLVKYAEYDVCDSSNTEEGYMIFSSDVWTEYFQKLANYDYPGMFSVGSKWVSAFNFHELISAYDIEGITEEQKNVLEVLLGRSYGKFMYIEGRIGDCVLGRCHKTALSDDEKRRIAENDWVGYVV